MNKKQYLKLYLHTNGHNPCTQTLNTEYTTQQHAFEGTLLRGFGEG